MNVAPHVDLQLGNRNQLPPQLFFFGVSTLVGWALRTGVQSLEETLVHVKQVAGEESSQERALCPWKVDLPDPALHGLMMSHRYQGEMELG